VDFEDVGERNWDRVRESRGRLETISCPTHASFPVSLHAGDTREFPILAKIRTCVLKTYNIMSKLFIYIFKIVFNEYNKSRLLSRSMMFLLDCPI
jgi:hypothetical protein